MRVTLLALTHTRVHVRGCKEPRFTKGGVHVFEAIARRHGIKSVSIDRNFKIGARSKKRESFLGGGLYLLREWQAPSPLPPFTPFTPFRAFRCTNLPADAPSSSAFSSHTSLPPFSSPSFIYIWMGALLSSPAPTVWIAGPDGSEDQLLKAKDDLLVLFDTHTNRITLKLDIPHELHFAIIGKRGEHQRSIMSQTGCHIHFPDLNKGGPRTAIKNQVSISGTPDGSETARLKLRGL